MQNLILAIHNHQPVGNFGSVFQEAYDLCYRPTLDLAAQFPKVKLALHYTGPLLEWLEKERPAFLKDVRELVARGQVEVLGGGFYEPMLAVLPDADARGQIQRMQEFCEAHFGMKPEGMWLAERVWDPDLPRVIAPTSTQYTFLDGSHFAAAGIPKEQLSGYYVTEKVGKALAVFPIDQELRYLIPWKPVPDVERALEQLSQKRGDDPRPLTYGDDGEKFGLWPGTQDWVFGKRWLHDFFKVLSDRGDIVKTMQPREVVEAQRPSGRVYLPTASYEEMGEWALPPGSMHAYEDLKRELRERGSYDRFQPFVRAGIWQGFFAKYPESNYLHKRVIAVSDRLQALEHKPELRAKLGPAREQLYRSECNCAYWHGVFGGLYLNNLRHGLWSALLTAEHLLDAIEYGDKPFLTLTGSDLEASRQPSWTAHTEALTAVVAGELGGSLVELSDLRHAFALSNVIARREEGYHEKLRHPPPTRPGEPPQAKEQNLERFLVFDDLRRTSFLDRFFAPGFGLDALRAGSDGDIGTFASGAYKTDPKRTKNEEKGAELALAHDGRLRLGGAGQPLRIEKIYAFRKGRAGLDVRYKLTNLGDEAVQVVFAPELNFTLLAGDAPDRLLELGPEKRERLTFRGEQKGLRRFSLFDGWSKLRVVIAAGGEGAVAKSQAAGARGPDLEPKGAPASGATEGGRRFRDSLDTRPFDLWSYPIETVSNSEGGFERTYQGTCLLLRTPVELKGKAALDLAFSIELEAA